MEAIFKYPGSQADGTTGVLWRGVYMNKRKEIPGQHNIFEFLVSQAPSIPEDIVQMEGVIDIKTLKDFTVQTTYRDVFFIINMLDDYVFLINQQGEKDVYTDYMLKQFERISKSLSEQIMLDKEKMYKKCRKAEKTGTVGEDALVLAAGKGKI